MEKITSLKNDLIYLKFIINFNGEFKHSFSFITGKILETFPDWLECL